MVYSLEFHPDAVQELDDALDWYFNEKMGLEQELFDEFLILEKRLTENPYLYHIVIDDIRQANFFRFPYSVYFLIQDKAILIIAFFHQKRDPELWKKRSKEI